jgi:23S rRNA pseudouridine2605 synthase
MSSEKLQKVLARAGLGSRRAMEAVIEAGRVEVNQRTARLGDRVGPSDRIRVDGRPLGHRRTAPGQRRVIAYHKPTGELVSRHDPEGRRCVFDRLPRLDQGRWIAIGRLDINTSGLLLLTTDGELASRLMHPRYRLLRDYAVRVYGTVEPATIERLMHGVELDDGRAAFDSVQALASREAANQWFRVRLRAGRNRLVRRLWASQGVRVSRLIRVQYGPIELPAGLREGQVDWLSAGQIRHLAELVGLDRGEPASTSPRRRSTGGGQRGRTAPRQRH